MCEIEVSLRDANYEKCSYSSQIRAHAMLRRYLPNFLNRELFGDRNRFGLKPTAGDADWNFWISNYSKIYFSTQREKSFAARINDAGYAVLDEVDVEGVQVCELGPGGCFHFDYLKGRPSLYTALDVRTEFLEVARNTCQTYGIPFWGRKTKFSTKRLPLLTESQDVFLSFYSLEHLHELDKIISEIFRVLRPGGVLIGAIPAEGGLAWGIGRWFTSRRTVRERYGLDLHKIICWEHPNYADRIMKCLSEYGESRYEKWPFPHFPLDVNLIVKFVVRKRK